MLRTLPRLSGCYSGVAKAIVAGVFTLGAATLAKSEALPIEAGSWTLAILPDTQHYVDNPANFHHFQAQTQWIADHAVSHNIKYMIHEGDITNNNNTVQWDRAKLALDTLQGVVPYALAPGNHDYGTSGSSNNRTSLYHNVGYYDPTSAYANQPTIGGFFDPSKTDNSFHTFGAGGQEWLILALEWGPRDEVVAWANDVVTDHPDHKVMMVTHAYMYHDETIYDWSTKGPSQSWNPHNYPIANIPGETVNDGQELWDKLVSQHENFQFTFNGHVLSDGTGFRSTLGVNNNPVHQMLANYQMNPEGGQADMRLLEFKADGQTVVVRTFSPSLDRYDTAYDQEFTLNLNELREPLAPPLIPTAVAANILVGGPAGPATNTVDSLTFPQASHAGVGSLEINRGDYQVAIDGNGLTYQQGVLLATMRENFRERFRATVEVGRSSFGDSLLALSVMEAGNPAKREMNFNTAVAWFQFAAGWQAAHVDAGGTINTTASNRIDPSMLTKQGVGRYSLDLGVDANHDGVLFAIGNNNDNIVVQTGVRDDGTWDIRVDDNAADFAATGEDREFSFVYLPYETEGLVAGLYSGATNTHLSSVGNFSMSRLSNGRYELSIDGHTPETGMLLLTVAGEATAGGVTAPEDNVLSYQDSGVGTFLIHSLDLPAVNLQDTSFAWAFISFSDPISPYFPPGDFNRDGVVDTQDYTVWRNQFGEEGEMSADGNGDGVVDAADYTIWRNNLQSPSPAAQTAAENGSLVPEPTSLAISLMLLGALAGRRRWNGTRPLGPAR